MSVDALIKHNHAIHAYCMNISHVQVARSELDMGPAKPAVGLQATGAIMLRSEHTGPCMLLLRHLE